MTHENQKKHIYRSFAAPAGSLFLLFFLCAGCAEIDARKRLEGVAKGWCETIRASQVVPVYPLTQDLMVGDVFLVQTPISTLEKEFQKKGFLPLDDAQVRLPMTNYTRTYFDGYWKDSFGNTPHAEILITNSGAFSKGLTEAPLPRAAFPTYSFKAQSGFGFNAAFPIEGIPVALGYLNSHQVDGSVTIADARTYAGDTGQLLDLLAKWFFEPGNRKRLRRIAINAAPKRIFLRIVSRVYFARALDISLQRSGSQAASGKGGTVSDVSLLTTNGSVNANYTNLLGTLTSLATTAVNTVSNMTQVGAAVKFVSASSSTIGLSQSFDHLLAIGYLGFDVEIGANGYLGVPIPTFQHQTKKDPPPAARPTRIGPQGLTVLPDVLFSVETILSRFADAGNQVAKEHLNKLNNLHGLDLPEEVGNARHPVYFFDQATLTLVKNREAPFNFGGRRLSDVNAFLKLEAASRDHLAVALKQIGDGRAVKFQESASAPVAITPVLQSALSSELDEITNRLETLKNSLGSSYDVIRACNYVESLISPRETF